MQGRSLYHLTQAAPPGRAEQPNTGFDVVQCLMGVSHCTLLCCLRLHPQRTAQELAPEVPACRASASLIKPGPGAEPAQVRCGFCLAKGKLGFLPFWAHSVLHHAVHTPGSCASFSSLLALNEADARADTHEACKILRKKFGNDFPVPEKSDTHQANLCGGEHFWSLRLTEGPKGFYRQG